MLQFIRGNRKAFEIKNVQDNRLNEIVKRGEIKICSSLQSFEIADADCMFRGQINSKNINRTPSWADL